MTSKPACNCNLRTRLVGDGCEVCNPEYAAQFKPTPAEAREAMENLELALKLASHYAARLSIPVPWLRTLLAHIEQLEAKPAPEPVDTPTMNLMAEAYARDDQAMTAAYMIGAHDYKVRADLAEATLVRVMEWARGRCEYCWKEGTGSCLSCTYSKSPKVRVLIDNWRPAWLEGE